MAKITIDLVCKPVVYNLILGQLIIVTGLFANGHKFRIVKWVWYE